MQCRFMRKRTLTANMCLTGRGQMHTGDTAGAIRAFDAVPDGACERGCEFAGLIHARLLASTRPRDALTILRSVRGVMYLRPYYAIERARIAERLKLFDEARTAYQSVLVFLRTPDIELMPLVSESNAALRRLDH